MTTESWPAYFQEGAARHGLFPWNDSYCLTRAERRAIARSVQQFQLGEGSNGRGLLRRGEAFARESGDRHLVAALELFIKEEQRHSAWLGRFLVIQGIPCLERHWVDNVFRRLRKLAGLELSVTVLVSAEIIAVPFYRALRNATRSDLLGAICERILADEAAHLRFQSDTLARLRTSTIRWEAHRWFLMITCAVVWMEHGCAFRAGGYSLQAFLTEALAELRGLRCQPRAEASCARSVSSL